MWKYNDKGEPQAHGGVVMDAVRMIASGFRTSATVFTDAEKTELTLPEYLRTSALEDPALSAGELASRQVAREIRLKVENPLKAGQLNQKKEERFWGS